MKVTSIQTRFLLMLLPLFIVCFGILSGVSYYLANQFLLNSVNETAAAIGTDYAAKIQFDLQEKLVRLDDLANTPRNRHCRVRYRHRRQHRVRDDHRKCPSRYRRDRGRGLPARASAATDHYRWRRQRDLQEPDRNALERRRAGPRTWQRGTIHQRQRRHRPRVFLTR